jgi:hypothetical protein
LPGEAKPTEKLQDEVHDAAPAFQRILPDQNAGP